MFQQVLLLLLMKRLLVYFQEEYIVPQLLLSYVRENQEIDGIRYLSTHYRQGEQIDKYINYVFPVTQIKDSGYDDELLDNFDIEVVLYQENTAQ